MCTMIHMHMHIHAHVHVHMWLTRRCQHLTQRCVLLEFQITIYLICQIWEIKPLALRLAFSTVYNRCTNSRLIGRNLIKPTTTTPAQVFLCLPIHEVPRPTRLSACDACEAGL